MSVDEIICKQVVELVTEYLEGALPAHDRTRFEEHLELCEGCQIYVDQMRDTIRVTGVLSRESVSEEAIAELCRAFRDWRTA
jgi:anti-sigma factor RsiW